MGRVAGTWRRRSQAAQAPAAWRSPGARGPRCCCDITDRLLRRERQLIGRHVRGGTSRAHNRPAGELESLECRQLIHVRDHSFLSWERSHGSAVRVWVNMTRVQPCPSTPGIAGEELWKPAPAHHGVSVPASALSIAVRQPATGGTALRTAAPVPLSASTMAMTCGVAQPMSFSSTACERLIDYETCMSSFDGLRCCLSAESPNANGGSRDPR